MRFPALLFSMTLVIAMGVCVMNSVHSACLESAPLTTVDRVDLDRYVGTWYEIAKIPNRFQRRCACCTTAYYNLRQDGRIDVVNRCIEKDGTQLKAKGIARVVDTGTNGRLSVSFVGVLGFWFFWGDYWIIGLGKDYDVALVGTPTRKYGWILSRQRELSKDDLERALFTASRQRV